MKDNVNSTERETVRESGWRKIANEYYNHFRETDSSIPFVRWLEEKYPDFEIGERITRQQPVS